MVSGSRGQGLSEQGGNSSSRSQGQELSLATAAAEHLRATGAVELLYITAEFEPYTSAQRPDLVFFPDRGPSSGKSFVVEIRVPRTGRGIPTVEELCEHRDFMKTEEQPLPQFALATNRSVSDDFRYALRANEIEVFDRVTSGKDLASRVLQWTSAEAWR